MRAIVLLLAAVLWCSSILAAVRQTLSYYHGYLTNFGRAMVC